MENIFMANKVKPFMVSPSTMLGVNNIEPFEIRIHSRGGQGAKTIGQILAEAAIEDGKFTEAFAEYGPERSGAPMQVFVRVSGKPILIHSNVKNPDMVILADSSLLGLVDVLDGLKNNGTIIINTAKNLNEIKSLVKVKKTQKIYSLDATKIAVEALGKDFSGIVLMGALNKITGIVSKAALEEELEEIFSRKKGKEVAEKNIEAFRKGYDAIKI